MRFLGAREGISGELAEQMDRSAVADRRATDGLTLYMAINYGGRAEIVQAARALRRRQRGGVRARPVRAGDARPRADHPHRRRAPAVELPAVAVAPTPSSCSATSCGPTSTARHSKSPWPSSTRATGASGDAEMARKRPRRIRRLVAQAVARRSLVANARYWTSVAPVVRRELQAMGAARAGDRGPRAAHARAREAARRGLSRRGRRDARHARAARHRRQRRRGDRRAGGAVRLPRRAHRASLATIRCARASGCSRRSSTPFVVPATVAGEHRAAGARRAAAISSALSRAVSACPGATAGGASDHCGRAADRLARRAGADPDACRDAARDRAARRVGARSRPRARALTGASSWPGAASSVLVLHALIAAAADPRTTPEDGRARSRRRTCRLACVLTLLDGLVDYEQDIAAATARARPGYLGLFEDREELAETCLARRLGEPRRRRAGCPTAHTT